jgi:hypothetical protein
MGKRLFLKVLRSNFFSQSEHFVVDRSCKMCQNVSVDWINTEWCRLSLWVGGKFDGRGKKRGEIIGDRLRSIIEYSFSRAVIGFREYTFYDNWGAPFDRGLIWLPHLAHSLRRWCIPDPPSDWQTSSSFWSRLRIDPVKITLEPHCAHFLQLCLPYTFLWHCGLGLYYCCVFLSNWSTARSRGCLGTGWMHNAIFPDCDRNIWNTRIISRYE